MILYAAPAPAAGGDWDLRVRVRPAAVEMGTRFTGADVEVSGFVRPGSKVAVVIRGENRTETFYRKARAGPIWITSGKVQVSGVPTLFLRFTDGMLRNFLARDAIDHFQMDQSAIQRQLEIHPDHDHETMVAGWLSLKAHDGTYGLVRDGVRMGQPGPAGVPFTVAFRWPRKAAPAEYYVNVYECRDNAVAGSASLKLPVVRVGFPAWLSALAKQRSLLYGALATLVAAAAGFGIDFLVALVFGRGAVAAR
ncbi:MAG: TIGR02186 family protein [Acidobacteria bacterium]|nr:TIGR02186 family protein [Acidobacteriota bacterium]